VLSALLLLLLCSLSPVVAQNCSTSLRPVSLISGGSPATTGNVSCNSTAYASFVYVTVVSTVAIGPVGGDGNVSSCDSVSLSDRPGAVGAQYALSLTCRANGTGLQGQCNAYYNFSLQCVQAPSSEWLTSSSSSSSSSGAGYKPYNAAARTHIGRSVWATLLLSVVVATVWSVSA